MQYLLMLYSDETMWSKLSGAQQEQGAAAYAAYGEALAKAGALKGSNRDHCARGKWQIAGARRPVCRLKRAGRRLLSDRRTRS
jgi:hypothetical protein